MYLHIEGRGDPIAIAIEIRSALALTATPVGAAVAPAAVAGMAP